MEIIVLGLIFLVVALPLKGLVTALAGLLGMTWPMLPIAIALVAWLGYMTQRQPKPFSPPTLEDPR